MRKEIEALQKAIGKLEARCDKLAEKAETRGWSQTSEALYAAGSSLNIASSEDLNQAADAIGDNS